MAIRYLIAQSVSVLATLTAAALLLTLLTRLHPVFDSLSQFRLHIALLLAALTLVAFLAGARLVAAGSGMVVVLVLAATYPFVPSLPTVGSARADVNRLRVVQFNTLYRNQQTELAARVIREANPDVILLEEATNGPKSLANLLLADYPVQTRCGKSRVAGTIVLSRLPASADNAVTCRNSHALSAIRLSVGGKAITFAAYHGRWPWPYNQASTIDGLSEDLSRLSHPLVLAGDFNAAPWSEGVQRVARMTDTKPAPGVRPTWLTFRLPGALRPWLGLPIDHVLVSDDLTIVNVERLAFAGSDHLPVLADIAY